MTPELAQQAHELMNLLTGVIMFGILAGTCYALYRFFNMFF